MSSIFTKELEKANDMLKVQKGVIRTLAEINPPLSYLIGHLDLNTNQPDSRLSMHSQLVKRFKPNVFSDAEVFTPRVVNLLQSYGCLKTQEELFEHRKTIIEKGNLETVIFLPDWDRSWEITPLYRFAEAVGRLALVLENPKAPNQPHDWLALNP
jgi:hypothetical protein